ncbi:MAG: hypothetical protein IPP38_09855 [Bacteroidetes bacterium]|nr:hypothetical protein [Bacteroidota bacterium]
MKLIYTLGLSLAGIVFTLQVQAIDNNPKAKEEFPKKFETNSLEAIRDFSNSIDHPVEQLPEVYRMEGARELPKAFAKFDNDKNQIITTQEMKLAIQSYSAGKANVEKTELCQLIDFFFNQYK